MTSYYLSESDVKLLQKVIDQVRKSTPTTRFSGENDPAYPPGHYVAKVPDGGIPALTIGSPDVPGSASCDIYRLNGDGTADPTLTEIVGLSKQVYNLTTKLIESRYVIVHYLTSGVWATDREAVGEPSCTGTGTCCIDSLDGNILQDLPTESNPSYVLGIDSNGCLVKVPVGDC